MPVVNRKIKVPERLILPEKLLKRKFWVSADGSWVPPV